MAKKVVEQENTVENLETAETIESTEIEEIETTESTEVEEIEVGKFREKAEQIAKRYGVSHVWGTADGAYWATTEEKKKKLPSNRSGIEEYSFPVEN